jgi:hypothetical protein
MPTLTKRARQTYRWKPGKRFRVSAKKAGAALEKIRRQNGPGGLTPAALVEAARDPEHVLHPEFCWDDSEAAEKWREQQARVLINSIRIVVIDDGIEPKAVIAFISVEEKGERSYRPSSVVMADPDSRLFVLHEALASLEGWKRRYAHLEELADIFAAIDTTKRKVSA